MLTYRELVTALRSLGLDRESRVLAHASLSSFEPVTGGEETVLGALLAVSGPLLMPAFTLRTMVAPPLGPADNGMTYGADNRGVEPFGPETAADAAMGELVEMLRRRPEARRSMHPIYSFVGVLADEYLEAQSLLDPLGPIARLAEDDGDVVLLGVDHRADVSLHYAERIAGRKTFLRWALTPQGVVTCPNSPGCSDGFQAVEPHLRGVVRRADIGGSVIEAIPVRDLVHFASAWLRQDPQAMLCDRPDCERCRDVRRSLASAA
ncbi:MAG: hypothetical protein A2Y93_09605 [Chloroflexi bacterium RBG_13_68_17]|jgi:aminoglycoside 3-N-acetyltransferase|nr:MAG: hypothetical protein A2Y93_09605 [Chloroflexi bacterium RBG_13_68_17]